MVTWLISTEAWLRSLDRRLSRARRDHRKLRLKYIKKLGKTKHILGLRIRRKLERNQELSESERVYVLRPPRGEHTDYTLSQTKHGLLDASKISELERHSQKSPIIMFRSTTLTGPKKTNGFTTSYLFVPSAHLMRDRGNRRGINDTSWIRNSITDIPLQELRPMLGQHLLWRDRIQDELLSWTMSYLFATVHLYLRHLKGQGVACISPINRTRTSNPVKWHVEQLVLQVNNPAKFYSANDLCDTTGVYHDHEWECRKDLPGLHDRKTNHEYITHGIVEYPKDDRLQQAAWGDLVVAGIFELIPELKVCFCSRAAGLYTVLRHIRTTNYNNVKKTTDRELAVAQKIAWLHTRLQPGEIKEQSRPNLWMLLYTLTFHKRVAGDQLFKKLIRRLGYTRQDLDENLYAGFGSFPHNLPEMGSLFYLAVDVQTVVGGQQLSAYVRTSTYSRSPLPESIQGDDVYYDIASKPRLIEVSNVGYEIKQSCGLACHCSIWMKTRKRKQIGGVGNDEGDEGDDEEEANKPQQSTDVDAITNDDHIGPSNLTARDSLEVSDSLKMHAEDERQAEDSLYDQEHNTMLLTYKYPTGTTY